MVNYSIKFLSVHYGPNSVLTPNKKLSKKPRFLAYSNNFYKVKDILSCIIFLFYKVKNYV